MVVETFRPLRGRPKKSPITRTPAAGGAFPWQHSLKDAAATLAAGGCVVYPTETYFALGARAVDASALERIAAIKARPASKPLHCWWAIRPIWRVFCRTAFWTAPWLADFTALTARFLAGAAVPGHSLPGNASTAGQGRARPRVGALHAHPTAAALCRLVGGALVATSANRSGQPPAAEPAELDPEVVAAADALVTAGPLPAGGPASTVADLLGGRRLRLFREGAVTSKRLQQAGYTIIPA